MTATTARPLPRWAWILSFLVPPSGTFLALGYVRLLPRWRAVLLAAVSLASVTAFSQVLDHLDEVHASSLMHAFGNSGLLAVYSVWFFVIYWTGQRASYWSRAAQRGWRWAARFAVAIYILNVINVLISIALLWVGGS